MTKRTSLLKREKLLRILRSFQAPQFSATPSSKSKQPAAISSILLCISVASRSLGLPTKGGATGCVHRVGWTALAGNDSEAWSIIAPSESEWVKGKMRGDMTGENPDSNKINITLEGARIEGRFGEGLWWQGHRVRGTCNGTFALREAPKTITDGKSKISSASKCCSSRPAKLIKLHDVGGAEQRMQNIVRAQGRLSKKGGKMISSGTDKFQIASGAALDSFVHGYRL
ncbi:hypothetical protein DFH29DRAFT_880754 [Suillus ampliporus]|nr:hypothetical protein DFH29DRAFT_880754 [Suillus ampliporus]